MVRSVISMPVYGLLEFSLCTQHCRHVHNHYWSGVFNLLKFDHTPKKKKKKKKKNL